MESEIIWSSPAWSPLYSQQLVNMPSTVSLPCWDLAHLSQEQYLTSLSWVTAILRFATTPTHSKSTQLCQPLKVSIAVQLAHVASSIKFELTDLQWSSRIYCTQAATCSCCKLNKVWMPVPRQYLGQDYYLLNNPRTISLVMHFVILVNSSD